MLLTPNQIARFRAKIKVAGPNECWLWFAGGHRYGRVRINDRPYLAHRVAWALAHGDAGEMCVLHECDTPRCCNPAHLFLGTHDDNMKDMAKKGRSPKRGGRENPNASLTEDQVNEIRASYVPYKVTLHALGAKYGVSFSTIHQIVQGNTWK